jgi:hypothetical protein
MPSRARRRAGQGGDRIGFQRQRAIELSRRLGKLALRSEEAPEVVVGFGAFRLELERAPIFFGGLRQLTEQMQHGAEIVVGRG